MFEKKDYLKFKTKPAIIDSNNQIINYETLFNLSDEIIKKIKKKSLIFLICGNNIESIVSYISCLRLKSVICLIDQKINKKHLKDQINIYKPEAIFIQNSVSSFNNYYLIHKFSRKIFNFFVITKDLFTRT